MSSLVWGSSDFLGGLRAKVLPAIAVVAWSQVFGLGTMTIVVLAGHPPRGTAWIPYAVAAGVAGAIALVSFYAALATGTMGVVAPISAMGAAVPVLLGVAQGDQPAPLVWAGMAVAVLGTVLASGPELRRGVHVRPVLLAVVAAIGFGLVLFFIDRGARSSLVSTLWGMRLTSVAAFAVIGLSRRSAGGVRRQDVPWLAAIGLSDLSANALFAAASAQGLVSVTSVLGSLYPVVTILLARVVLGERLRVIQNIGVVLSLAGVVAIATG